MYRIAVKEFDKIRRKYFAACGNARKDSMFRILQQLLLLLKICADPSLAYEYDSNEIPTKVKKQSVFCRCGSMRRLRLEYAE